MAKRCSLTKKRFDVGLAQYEYDSISSVMDPPYMLKNMG
jgi:hypothetical protein